MEGSVPTLHTELHQPHRQVGMVQRYGGFYPILPIMVQMVKNLPAVQETPVASVGQEDPPEKRKATHSIVHA